MFERQKSVCSMQCESELQNKPSVSTELNCFVPYEDYRHKASQRTDWEWLEGSLALWNMSGSDPTKTNIPFKPRIGWTSLMEVHQDHSINIFFRGGVRQFFFCFSLMLLSKCVVAICCSEGNRSISVVFVTATLTKPPVGKLTVICIDQLASSVCECASSWIHRNLE